MADGLKRLQAHRLNALHTVLPASQPPEDGSSVGFHENPTRSADDQSPEPRWLGQNEKRDKGIEHLLSRIVVAEQWVCCLWALICMTDGGYGLFVSFDPNSSSVALRWLGTVQEPIWRFTAIASFVVGVVLIRCGLGVYFLLRRALDFGLEWNGKEQYERRRR